MGNCVDTVLNQLNIDPHYLTTKTGALKLGEIVLSLVAWGLMVEFIENRPARIFPEVVLLVSAVSNTFWVVLNLKPIFMSLHRIDPNKPPFPILEMVMGFFWSAFTLAAACSLALDTGDHLRLSAANLVIIILVAVYFFDFCYTYKKLEPDEELERNSDVKETEKKEENSTERANNAEIKI